MIQYIAELYCGALVFYNSKNLNCVGALSFVQFKEFLQFKEFKVYRGAVFLIALKRNFAIILVLLIFCNFLSDPFDFSSSKIG